MPLFGNFFNRNVVASPAPQPKSASAPAVSGAAYTVARLLGSTSTLSLTANSNANLTLSGAVISQTNPIPTTTSQIAIVREALGNTAIEYPVTLAGTYVPPAVIPLPSGIAAMWDAASLNLADGAAVTSWTDGIGGSVAAVNSGASHTYVTNSGGLPAVRVSGTATLATSGTNAAATAMNANDKGIIVVARNIKDGSQANPCLVSVGTGTGLLLQATTSTTGLYGFMTSCADAGMRTIGYSGSTAGLNMVSVNGSCFAGRGGGSGQVVIGGWKDTSTSCGGSADILAVIVFGRAVTAADFKVVHRHYCELLGQTRPGGGNQKNVLFIGDSLTAGAGDSQGKGDSVPFVGAYPVQLATGLNLPWGTWDNLGIAGLTFDGIQRTQVPGIGNVSAATGKNNIVCCFEWANESQFGGDPAPSTIISHGQSVVNAVLAADANAEIIMGTSTDRGDQYAYESDRATYNSLVSGMTGIVATVSLHLDPIIGVSGAALASGAQTYFQPDTLHFRTAGYARIDNGPNGFRPAVQARLATN